MRLKTRLNGVSYSFKNLKEVFAKANEPKAGDRLQGIAAATASERIAAKVVVSELTIQDITENPFIPYDEDAVREYILKHTTTSEDLIRLSVGLTGEVAAAVAKIMSTMDLVYGARKIYCTTRCNTEIGQPGTLSYRCQANSPTDDASTILAGLMEGVSFGCGDACLGINPVEDNPESTRRIGRPCRYCSSRSPEQTRLTRISVSIRNCLRKRMRWHANIRWGRVRISFTSKQGKVPKSRSMQIMALMR